MSPVLLYLDPWSGLSGDMLLGSLLDAGGEAMGSKLQQMVASMDLRGVRLEVTRDTEWGIGCTRVNVCEEDAPPLRHLEDMLQVIARAETSERVKTQAGAAVRRLAEVEANIHGCSLEEIHFHEVGAADTLVDVIGAFLLIEALGVKHTFVGTIPVGGGTVEIAHGRMGVPAPATAVLLTGYEVIGGPEMRELTTPTGALLLGELKARQGPFPALKVKAVGYGAGTMRLQHGPNLLRAVLGEAPDAAAAMHSDGLQGRGGAAVSEAIVELQTNIDDVSPEVIGYTLRRLREAGVLDAWTVPVQMKKDRPGVVLHVLAAPGDEAEAVRILFSETGTLGIRRAVLSRYVADRGVLNVSVGGSDVAVKWGRWGDHTVSLAPEYEDVVAAAATLGATVREVMHRANEAARRLLDKGGPR
jgi:uncharacterized protein (TIGR00299 family) protein